ncbi:MAG: hypothetical protein MUE70_00620 [Desulfobacterales bacterium]|jgi:hypothetical protein|nr:hypothetical protein [Desulfobacterales bacterium]
MGEYERDFVHPRLNEQITAIGGKYILLKEDRVALEGKDILFLTGVAVFDSTCCGSGGCSYAVVPGFVRKWKYQTDANGNPVSLVEPVAGESEREKIRLMLFKKEPVYQVDFL